MKTIFNLVKRNILLYIRDKSAVFFSLLSMLIVIGLMVVFLGDMNSDNLVHLLSQYGGVRDTALDKENASNLIMMWTIGGVIMVNAVTVTLTMVGLMVQDREKNRLASFYIAPVKRYKIMLGYIIAAFIVGVIVCLFTLGLGEFVMVLSGGTLLGIVDIIKIILLIVANVFTFCCFMFLVILFVKSNSALSGIETIIGTLVGFVGAIYLPMGMLPDLVQKVLKSLPVLHGASLLRQVCTESALNTTFKGMPAEVINEYKDYMGITVKLGDSTASASFQMAFLLFCGIIMLVIATLLLRKKAISDR